MRWLKGLAVLLGLSACCLPAAVRAGSGAKDSSARSPTAALLFQWEQEEITLAEVTNRLSLLSDDNVIVGVYEPPSGTNGSVRDGRARKLFQLGIPILEPQQDGSYSLPASAAAADEGPKTYKLSTRQLEATRHWLGREKGASGTNQLELNVNVVDDAERVDIRKLELGGSGRILWFIYEEDDEEQKNSVEIRLPF